MRGKHKSKTIREAMNEEATTSLFNYVICYNIKCNAKNICGHFYTNLDEKDGGYWKFIGSGTTETCNSFDRIEKL